MKQVRGLIAAVGSTRPDHRGFANSVVLHLLYRSDAGGGSARARS